MGTHFLQILASQSHKTKQHGHGPASHDPSSSSSCRIGCGHAEPHHSVRITVSYLRVDGRDLTARIHSFRRSGRSLHSTISPSRGATRPSQISCIASRVAPRAPLRGRRVFREDAHSEAAEAESAGLSSRIPGAAACNLTADRLPTNTQRLW